MPCQTGGKLDAACLGQVVDQFGLRAIRRPLQPVERQRFLDLGLKTGATDLWLGAQYVAAAFLQSADFLYRVEVGEPAPEHPGWLRYTPYEMATRLSFLLRSSTPDSALLDAASNGSLATQEGVRAQAERLLAGTAVGRALGPSTKSTRNLALAGRLARVK